jgi:hypothetical protein
VIVGRSLRIARGDATKLLVAAPPPRKLVAPAVAGAVDGAGAMLMRLPRHGDADTRAPRILTARATAIRRVADTTGWSVLRPPSALTLHATTTDQRGKHGGCMPLAWRQQPREALAGTGRPAVAFRADAAAAPPERFGLGRPFVAPAAG